MAKAGKTGHPAGKNNMFVVMNRFFVKPQYAGQFETRIRNRPRQVDRQKGFIGVQLLRPVDPEGPYIVLTVWKSEADFETWVGQDSFKEKHAGPRTLPQEIFWQANQVEKFEVLLDTNSR